jgi:hypothetical protein
VAASLARPPDTKLRLAGNFRLQANGGATAVSVVRGGSSTAVQWPVEGRLRLPVRAFRASFKSLGTAHNNTRQSSTERNRAATTRGVH